MSLFTSLFRRGGKAKAARQTQDAWRRRPLVESLEDRTLLSAGITVPTAGSPGPATLTGTAGADQFTIRLDNSGSNFQFSETDSTGQTHNASAAVADVTSITINGLQGNDKLTLDVGNGLVGNTKSGGLSITYSGGPGLDTLVLTGNAGTGVTEIFTAASGTNPATLTIGNGTVSDTITLNQISSIVDTMTADSLVINANDANNLINIRQGPTVGGQATMTVQALDIRDADLARDDHPFDDRGGGDDKPDGTLDNHGHRNEAETDENEDSFLPITFANKTTVTVNGLGGNDLFVVNAAHAAAGLKNLNLDGGTGFNVLLVHNLPAGVTLTPTNFQIAPTDADDMFIEELYETRLGRLATQQEVNEWKAALTDHDDAAHRMFVIQGIEESAEGRDHLVRGWYQRYLGRDADGREEQGWVRLLEAGESEEQVLSGILNSQEFLARAQQLFNSGNAGENFVRALYDLLLDRDSSGDEIQGWINAVSGEGREWVALAILGSQEFREDALEGFYTTILRRDADDAIHGMAAAHADLHHLREGFLDSEEFFGNA